MIDERFVLIGASLSLIGSGSYLIATIRGKTKPNRVSWFLWSLAAFIAFSAEIKGGVGLIALMTFMVGFNPLLIFLASFINHKAAWKLGRLDIICGILSAIGIVLWLLTGSGYLAIAFCILADGLAAVPTIVKSYKHPESENWHVFFCTAISASIALLAIGTWNFAHWGFPLYTLLVTVLLVVLIKFKIGVRRTLAPRRAVLSKASGVE